MAEDNADSKKQQEELSQHYRRVVRDLADGQVIPFLGAGVNLCNRPAGIGYEVGRYLPSGRELAKDLAKNFDYPWDDVENLLRVSWYVDFKEKTSVLYRHLHRIFSADYPLTDVHTLLAELPGYLRGRGYDDCYQILVTTNYDDVLERAFRQFGEPFDVVYYVAVAEDNKRGKFVHLPHEGKPIPILDCNSYYQLPIDDNLRVQRTIILKIHGAVNRANWAQSSFVITEDDYIEYMARLDQSNPLPAMLAAKMRLSSFLFLGYSLGDWNLRVILHRIFAGRPFGANSWAILDRAEEQDEKFWESRDVDFLRVQLDRYIVGLRNQLDSLQQVVRVENTPSV
jgi:hypothetical protein